jgi:NADH-quinone oxidoreductase subunit A
MEHIDVSHPYFGIFFLLVFTVVAFVVTTMLARMVGKILAARDTERLKLSIYECGPESSLQPNRLSSQFYLYALLFILFDVEIIFMFPWAVDFKILGTFGFIEMISFIFLLTVGFVYAWVKGAFQWHSMR